MAVFFGQAAPGAYAALQAYLRPCPETAEALQRLRLRLAKRFVSLRPSAMARGFSTPRASSTRETRGRGLFLQFTADDPRDAPIPDALGRPEASLTFGLLKTAQAFGDRQALISAGRRVIRFHLHGDPSAASSAWRQPLRASKGEMR